MKTVILKVSKKLLRSPRQKIWNSFFLYLLAKSRKYVFLSSLSVRALFMKDTDRLNLQEQIDARLQFF